MVTVEQHGLLPTQPAWARITIDQGDAMGRP
jgi:hypothetical protein